MCAFIPDDFVISGRWVGTEKSPGVHRARWFWRGFEEKVEESDLFASTSLVTSTRLLLAAAAARRFEGVACYTAHVAGAFSSASVDPDERSCGAPPAQWQPRNVLDGRSVI